MLLSSRKWTLKPVRSTFVYPSNASFDLVTGVKIIWPDSSVSLLNSVSSWSTVLVLLNMRSQPGLMLVRRRLCPERIRWAPAIKFTRSSSFIGGTVDLQIWGVGVVYNDSSR